MGKSLFIAEKPSVAMEFSKALKENMTRHDGYQESDNLIVTWCVGHLITMSYPEVYDEKYKKWRLDTLPFIPDKFLYEVIGNVKKQFGIVSSLLKRPDVDVIYVCTDSGREGEYIYRLVAQMAGVKGKEQKRVWIDSQTEEEILKGIRTAKDLSEYDRLADSAYLRAQEDYLMGINFSRLLTLKYGDSMASYLGEKYCVISVGRVMTCVLGMIVRREREIRSFVKTPFYRVTASLGAGSETLEAEWRAVEGSDWYQSPKLYKENGFKELEDAEALIRTLTEQAGGKAEVEKVEKKKEKKNPPLLYNLAELQNDCSKMFRISPDQTLSIVQELYEKKLVTYPRTDARVLSSAVAKEIRKNISGLNSFGPAAPFAADILGREAYKGLEKTRYVNDSQITDHYAIIPTGSGLGALRSLSQTAYGVYSQIVKRFLGIFYPPAEYLKVTIVCKIGKERFFASLRFCTEEGYLAVMKPEKKSADAQPGAGADPQGNGGGESAQEGSGDSSEMRGTPALLEAVMKLRKGSILALLGLFVKEGETSPPRRYNSGSIILAMENAGQLIEDDSLREQIRGSGIGTSATRAEILKKLVTNRYIALNKKTQILTPTLRGEMIYDVVDHSIRPLLNAELTASWEKGLTYVAEGSITSDEYMEKMRGFIVRQTNGVMNLRNQTGMRQLYDAAAVWYKKEKGASGDGGTKREKSTARRSSPGRRKAVQDGNLQN